MRTVIGSKKKACDTPHTLGRGLLAGAGRKGLHRASDFRGARSTTWREPGYFKDVRMHNDEHFTQRSLGLWNHLRSLVKQQAPSILSLLHRRKRLRNDHELTSLFVTCTTSFCGAAALGL